LQFNNIVQINNLKKDLTEIMATSTNYTELEYVWTQWREEAGKPVRQQYIEFVALNNKAATLNGKFT
jgi:peptidyl-dipeptidase A